MLLNCGVGEDSWESLGLQGDPTSPKEILKEISPDYSLEGLMLKLKLQSFGHLMRRADSLEKPLMLGKIEGRRWRGWQRMRSLAGITDLMDMNLSKLWGILEDRGPWCATVYEVTKSQTWLSNWTTAISLSEQWNIIQEWKGREFKLLLQHGWIGNMLSERGQRPRIICFCLCEVSRIGKPMARRNRLWRQRGWWDQLLMDVGFLGGNEMFWN